jgi:hypothetical protein
LSEVDPRLREQLQKGLTGGLLALGALFIGIGAILGLGVAWVVYRLVEDPKSIALVAQLLEAGATNLRGARGTLEGRPFEIELGEPLFLLLALFVGAIVLGIVAGIAKRLMLAGVELIRPVLAELRRTP